VTDHSVWEFSCVLAAKAEPTAAGTPTWGSHGIRHRFINKTAGGNPSIHNLVEEVHHENSRGEDGAEVSEFLALSMELNEREHVRSGNLFRGWFVPPKTTKYRFYQACDDNCKLKIGKTPGSTEDLEELLGVVGYA